MTHAFPDDRELAKINKWIDRHVKFEYLQHRHRMGDLLNTQMIARSVVEYLFLCRECYTKVRTVRLLTSTGALSIYAHTKTAQGLAGPDKTLDTDSLDVTFGTINNRIYSGITANSGRQIVLRGECAGTRTEATVRFIEAVLDTSSWYQSELLKQMEESINLAGKLRDPEGSDNRKPKV